MNPDGLRQQFVAVQSGASARLIQVIEIQVRRGCGFAWCMEPDRHGSVTHQHERVRMVKLYFTPDGTLLAEHDPCPGPLSDEEMRRSAVERRFAAARIVDDLEALPADMAAKMREAPE